MTLSQSQTAISVLAILLGVIFIAGEMHEFRGGVMLMLVGIAGFALGVWLWRKPSHQ